MRFYNTMLRRAGLTAAAGLLAILTVPVSATGVSEQGTYGDDPPAPASVTPIQWEGDTSLPAYNGQPAKAHPLPPTKAPQNPFFAPNPFSNYHNDTWMSDSFDIPGPLGRAPKTWSSALTSVNKSGTPLIHCGTLAFDRHGRIVTICSNSAQTTTVVLDPASLEVLASMDLPSAGDMAAGLGAGYMMLDNLDRAWSPIGRQLVAVSQQGAPNHTTLSYETYDMSSVVPEGDVINSLVPDTYGRIWFVARHSGVVGVFDPAKGPSSVGILDLSGEISNSFAMDGADAYIVTTEKLFRLRAGRDNIPYEVWSADYQNAGYQKQGQLSAGSGTTPTILRHGNFVAIADNAEQAHVVVYRTAEKLGRKEQRMVCEVPVFPEGHGAVEDSLVGTGRSLVVTNNFGFAYTSETDPRFVDDGSEPGMERVDIDPNGEGCRKVWANEEVNPASYGTKLSTRTGLLYVLARKSDPARISADYPMGMNVWYWTAIDFRTGHIVWEQIAGTGRWFDGYWPLLFIGPDGTLYGAGNGGVLAMKDTG